MNASVRSCYGRPGGQAVYWRPRILILGSPPQGHQRWSRGQYLRGCRRLRCSWEGEYTVKRAFVIFMGLEKQMFLLHLIPVRGFIKTKCSTWRLVRFPSPSKESPHPITGVPVPEHVTFWVVNGLMHLSPLRKKVYTPTHFVHFFFIQKFLVLYSSHVYASAILLASFLSRWYCFFTTI